MKIALIGYGVEGLSAYTYFSKVYPDAEFTVYDESDTPKFELPSGVQLKSGARVLEQVIDADIVVRSPGIRPSKLHTDGRITSVTREFFDKCPAPIIGVTGSKGKGTTASFIYEILTAAAKKVWLVGNIGKPALDILQDVNPGDIIVYELSSFQLWDIEKSPHVAVVLMIEPEHLDVHADTDEYVSAKANIRKYQTVDDVCFYHPTNEYARQIAESGQGRALRYGVEKDGAVYVSSNTFFIHSDPICNIDAVQLPGEHNLENACAAISAALEYTDDFAAVEKGLRAFQGLPHRLKYVREVHQVKYYDDSIATTPGSAIAALKAFDEPKVIILGGSDKGADFTELAEAITKNNVREVITIGKLGPQIAEIIRAKGYDQISETVGGMTAIVDAAYSAARPGDVVIMSPACASFDMFKNYADRGEQFIEAVEKLQ